MAMSKVDRAAVLKKERYVKVYSRWLIDLESNKVLLGIKREKEQGNCDDSLANRDIVEVIFIKLTATGDVEVKKLLDGIDVPVGVMRKAIKLIKEVSGA